MNRKSVQIATGGLTAALCVVLLLLGSIGELGVYAAPMFAGLILVPLGQRWGRRYQFSLWLLISLLSLFLVPSIEENLMFFGLFGWYPILRPTLEKLPKHLRFLAKFLVLNLSFILLEALVMFLLIPAVFSSWLAVAMLLLINITFFFYDLLIPRFGLALHRLIHKLMHKK